MYSLLKSSIRSHPSLHVFFLLTIYTIFDEENKRKKKLNAFLLTLHGGTSLVCVLGLGTSLLHSTLSPQSAEDSEEEGEE